MNVLRRLLGRPQYQTKAGNPWTLHELLAQISTELSPLNPLLEGSTLKFADRNDVEIVFIRNQFPPKDTMMEINGTITTSNNNYVADLFHLAKPYFGNRARPLGIFKDQSWEGSRMQAEVREFYLPFLGELSKLTTDNITSNNVDGIVSRLKNKSK